MTRFHWSEYINARQAPGAQPLLVRLQRRPGWVWKFPAFLAVVIMAPALLVLAATAIAAVLVFLVMFVILGYLSDLLSLVGLGPRRRAGHTPPQGGADPHRPTVHIQSRVVDD